MAHDDRWRLQAADEAVVVVDDLLDRQPGDRGRISPKLLDLARFANVHVKLCGLPALSKEAFPYRDAWPALRAITDAFGADRLMWASDTTRFGVKIVMSGPLVADDGKTMIGSFFLVEAPSRAEVEAFHQSDPFLAAGIWKNVTITGFLRRQG